MALRNIDLLYVWAQGVAQILTPFVFILWSWLMVVGTRAWFLIVLRAKVAIVWSQLDPSLATNLPQ